MHHLAEEDINLFRQGGLAVKVGPDDLGVFRLAQGLVPVDDAGGFGEADDVESREEAGKVDRELFVAYDEQSLD